ncbi:MAG: c-type cytochrome [Yoonia sp.]|nr:c-type cytochrome [Yoonia sp.]
MKHFNRAATFALISLLYPAVTLADEIGKAEYMNTCATCHGEGAAGDGPLAELMTVPVPPLTGLSAANDGAFPMLEVIQTIDGRSGTRGHGYPMPIWGARFRSEISDADSAGINYGTETIVRARMLSLALYLESIQQ